MNQYANTGTMVSDTSSEAEQRTPRPDREGPEQLTRLAADPTDGRNTATVVSVEAVTAPATWRTAPMIGLA